MTIKIENTNPSFGNSGPFESEGIDSMVDSMRENFATWAGEKYQDYLANFDTRDGEPIGKMEFVANEIEEMAIEFESGLKIVGAVVNGYDMDQLNGEYSTAELVNLRCRQIAWHGDRNLEAEQAIRCLCDDALDQIGTCGEATGAEFKGGAIVWLLLE